MLVGLIQKLRCLLRKLPSSSLFCREALAFVQQLMRNHGTIRFYFFSSILSVFDIMVKMKEP